MTPRHAADRVSVDSKEKLKDLSSFLNRTPEAGNLSFLLLFTFSLPASPRREADGTKENSWSGRWTLLRAKRAGRRFGGSARLHPCFCPGGPSPWPPTEKLRCSGAVASGSGQVGCGFSQKWLAVPSLLLESHAHCGRAESGSAAQAAFVGAGSTGADGAAPRPWVVRTLSLRPCT